LEVKQRAMAGEIADLVDRLDHFMNRERVRRSRDRSAERETAQEAPGDAIAPPPGRSAPPPTGFDPKDNLRAIARAKGVLR
jgi:hypothetical protein